jgi:hypothetical protein
MERLLLRGTKMAASAQVIRDSAISVKCVNGILKHGENEPVRVDCARLPEEPEAVVFRRQTTESHVAPYSSSAFGWGDRKTIR